MAEETKKNDKAASLQRDIQLISTDTQTVEIKAPRGMGLEEVLEGLSILVKAHREQKQTIDTYTDTYWQDALVAAWMTVKEVYPLVATDPAFPKTPQSFAVERNGEETVHVPFGTPQVLQVMSPTNNKAYPVKMTMFTTQESSNSAPYMVIKFEHPGFADSAIRELQQKIRETIKSARYSRIKGQVVEMDFSYAWNGVDYIEKNHKPFFRDVGKFDMDQLVYNKNVTKVIDYQILARIDRPNVLRRAGIEFNSNHLLIGPYGTGKSALINAVLKRARDKGLTCVIAKEPRDLVHAAEWLRAFEPAVLVCEDVDRIMSGEERDINQDVLTNVMDGINSKSRQLMMIMTANDPDKIHPVFLRPGRMTSMIPLRPLEADDCLRLLGKLVTMDDPTSPTWIEVGQRMNQFAPSAITEIATRAKLAAMSDGADPALKVLVRAEHVLAGIEEIDTQIKMANRTPQPPPHSRVAAAKVLAEALEKAGDTELPAVQTGSNKPLERITAVAAGH